MNHQEMQARIAASIENGNSSRIIKWPAATCERKAREALEATGYKSLAAAYRYLNSQRIAHD